MGWTDVNDVLLKFQTKFLNNWLLKYGPGHASLTDLVLLSI